MVDVEANLTAALKAESDGSYKLSGFI